MLTTLAVVTARIVLVVIAIGFGCSGGYLLRLSTRSPPPISTDWQEDASGLALLIGTIFALVSILLIALALNLKA